MKFLKDIFNLFYPEVCLSCKQSLLEHEKIICLHCRHDFPETDFLNKPNNQLEKQFFGRIQIKEATALFYFSKKGKVQHLIHQLKYRGQETLGAFFGSWMGEALKNSNRFKVDVVVPVPIHPKKRKQRGYNQLTLMGVEVAQNLKVPFVEDKLIRTINTNTQTHKGRAERYNSVQKHFEIVDTEFFEGKRILLIDDVITTGATIEACVNQLLKSKNVTVSVAVIAYTA